jgi:hypothetical protein
MSRCCAKQKQNVKGVWHTSHRSSRPATLRRRGFFPFTVSACLFRCRGKGRNKQPEDGRKEKSQAPMISKAGICRVEAEVDRA